MVLGFLEFSIYQARIRFPSLAEEVFDFFALLVGVVAAIGVDPFERVFNAVEKILRGFVALGRWTAAGKINRAAVRVDRLVKAVALVAPEPGGDPAVAVDIYPVANGAFAFAFGIVFPVDDAAIHRDFSAVNRVKGCECGFYVERAARRQFNRGAHGVIVYTQVNGGTIGDEGVARFHTGYPVFVGERATGVDIDAVVRADEPVGAGGGGQGDAAIEQFVPQVVFGVHPEGIEQIEGVQFAQCRGNGGFHTATVVTPYDNAALIAGFVAAKAQRGIVGVELRGEDVAAADGLDEVADVEEHDVPISEPPGRVFAVVAVFFADVEYVMCGGKFVHHADGIFVAGVGELSSVEDAYDGDVVAFHATVDGQTVVGAGFFFVVVDVRVARIPVVFLRVIPAVEGNFDVFDAVFRHFDYGADGLVFRAAFDQYVGASARGLNFKFAIAEEEGRAGSAFEHGFARVTKTAVGGQDVYFGVDVFAGRAVDNMSVQGAHR